MTYIQPKSPLKLPLHHLSERDLRILHLVYEHRFIDTELLWHFVREDSAAEGHSIGNDGKRRPRKYGFGKKAIYKRLHQLVLARYLRQHQAMARRVGHGFGGARTAFGLGPASARVLNEIAGISLAQVRDAVEANRVRAPFIEHSLEIARFRVILELACRNSRGQVHLLFWEQGIGLQDWIWGTAWDGERRRLSVYPDAFFGIEITGRKAHFFLEMDMGTMPIIRSGDASDIRKKVYGYYFYRKAGRLRHRYRHRTLPDGTVAGLEFVSPRRSGHSSAEAQSLIDSFRVLFVTPGSIENGGSPKGRIANILAEFQYFGRQFSTSTLFWFATQDSFELSHPESILAPYWLTPNPTHNSKCLISQ